MENIDVKIEELEKQLKEAKAEKERQALENPKTIGMRVRKMMYANCVTQTELAFKLGCSVERLNRCLNDIRKFDLEMVTKISKIFKIPCDYLVFGEENTVSYNVATVRTLKSLATKYKNRVEELEEEVAELKSVVHEFETQDD